MASFERHQTSKAEKSHKLNKRVATGLAAVSLFGLAGCGDKVASVEGKPAATASETPNVAVTPETSPTQGELEKKYKRPGVEIPKLSEYEQQLKSELDPNKLLSYSPEELDDIFTMKRSEVEENAGTTFEEDPKKFCNSYARLLSIRQESLRRLGYADGVYPEDFDTDARAAELVEKVLPHAYSLVGIGPDTPQEDIDVVTDHYVRMNSVALDNVYDFESGNSPVLQQEVVEVTSVKVNDGDGLYVNGDLEFTYEESQKSLYDTSKEVYEKGGYDTYAYDILLNQRVIVENFEDKSINISPTQRSSEILVQTRTDKDGVVTDF